MRQEIRVGYWVAGGQVLCPDCMVGYCQNGGCTPEPIRLDFQNIFPYNQSCHVCGKVLVEGRTKHWPELFKNPNNCERTELTEEPANKPANV